jgi:hypothetical protein
MHTAAADADAIVRGWKTVENMSGSIMVRTMSLPPVVLHACDLN